ncbi:RNA polymerase sigma factor [Streptomyces sp. NRRL F-5123]|uniref:RNA polymerase sigma factor n=1 Tax=Streptomyces sp. NRRL F-5123 TaxID=1463856 RepID=UPI0004E0CCDA|nr:sigma-70 family RNA polymerase sigma factor [Streptomyces sp. NRRL F-5123]
MNGGEKGPEDAALVAAVLTDGAGPQRVRALETIASRHYRAVLRQCARMLGENAQDGADVAQKVFEDAVASLLRGRGPANPEKLGAWLAEFARRRVRAYWRDKRPGGMAVIPGDDGFDELADDEESRSGSAERRAHVERLLAIVVGSLTGHQQQIYRLRIVEGLSGREIAARMGMAVSTANNEATALKGLLADGFHALVLAQEGRPHCAELAAILDAAGVTAVTAQTFTPALRERIVRHFATCAVCDKCGVCQVQRRFLAGPYSPVFFPIVDDTDLRERVLDHIRQAAGGPPANPPGSPAAAGAAAAGAAGAGLAAATARPLTRLPGRRGAWTAAVAAVVAVALVAALVVALTRRHGSGTATAPPRSPATTTTAASRVGTPAVRLQRTDDYFTADGVPGRTYVGHVQDPVLSGVADPAAARELQAQLRRPILDWQAAAANGPVSPAAPVATPADSFDELTTVITAGSLLTVTYRFSGGDEFGGGGGRTLVVDTTTGTVRPPDTLLAPAAAAPPGARRITAALNSSPQGRNLTAEGCPALTDDFVAANVLAAPSAFGRLPFGVTGTGIAFMVAPGSPDCGWPDLVVVPFAALTGLVDPSVPARAAGTGR